ncbi:MAG TPA: FAD-dependent monooxygenase, partial [Pseudonocardia sp.]
MVHRPRVLVIGGGIGGLCLAHGLRADGVDVTVFERTFTRTDWLQGYRIHIDPHGSAALHECLAPAAWDRFRTAVSTQPTGIAMRTEQLRTLVRFDDRAPADGDPARQHHGISRIALREALLTGLDGAVRFGAELTGYEPTADGRVRARFTDGSAETGDLLVGADGGNSRVRRQLLPEAGRVDIGVTAVV